MAKTSKGAASRPVGRPTQYTPELAQEICERIASGETLIAICSEPAMPKETTVRGWDFDDRKGNQTPATGFASLYARAVEMRTEHELDRLRELAATPVIGEIVTERQIVDKKTGQVVTLREVRSGDAVEARRLEVDALKWRISKIGWRVYGVKAPTSEKPEEGDGAKLIIEGGLPEDDHAPPPGFVSEAEPEAPDPEADDFD